MTASYHEGAEAALISHMAHPKRHYMADTNQFSKISAFRFMSKLVTAKLTPRARRHREARRHIENYEHDYSYLYDHLEEPVEQRTLLEILACRLLGNGAVPLADLRHERRLLRELQRVFDGHAGSEVIEHRGWSMRKMDLRVLGLDFSFFVNPIILMYSFAKRQYENPHVGFRLPKSGHFIDAGACYGDTALWMAASSRDARVHAFELMPGNRTVLAANLALNPKLRNRIVVCDAPLSDKSGEMYYVRDGRAGAAISQDADDFTPVATVESLSIDDYVADNGLPSVDFIKMDIEGSEYDALLGARDTIARFRPQLAISVYHYACDLDRIPRLIHDIDSTYAFSLQHHSGSLLETILYCQ